MTARLSEATLAELPPGIARPTYDRRCSKHGLVHLGPGAFHRAHQAVFTEDAQLAGGEPWTITGVSLRHGETKAALSAQDGLYAVEFLSERPHTRVVGVLTGVLTAADEPGAVLTALATASIVTLTITEAGYCLNGEGVLDFNHPDVALDLADGAHSAVGWIVRGLAGRRRSGAAPLTILSCDNLLHNGARLEAAVLALADRLDPSLAAWVQANAAFPCSMVDCIVPGSDVRHRERVKTALGLGDQASAQRETFAAWAIEDRFVGPRPAWERVGVDFVTSVAAHERLKLHGLNAVHSALAYLGLLRGLEYMREAIADPELAAFADAMIAEDVHPALPDLAIAPYWRGVRARLANPMLDHRLSQIGEDGSVKLAQRIFPLIFAGARAGRPTPHLAAVVQAWLECARRALVKDARSERLAAWAAAGADVAAALDDPLLFSEPFRREPAVRVQIFEADGMTRAVCIGECMIELSARSDGTYVRAFAGDAYNTAVHLKRCTPALEVQFATVTGDDTLSEAMREAWRGEGIDDSLATRAPGLSPGLYLVETDGDGERRFSYWRGQSAARRWLSALEGHGEAIAGADLLFMTGISLAILRPEVRARALDLIDRLRPTIGLFALDPNIRPSLWDSERAMRETCEAAMGRADILLPSLDDAAQLWGAAGAEVHFRHALALGAREVALTLGAEGCLVTSLDGSARRIAAQPVAVIDSAGAGDAFNGAYLASRLMGEAPEAAAAAGLALAKRVIGHAGALPSAVDLAGGTP